MKRLLSLFLALMLLTLFACSESVPSESSVQSSEQSEGVGSVADPDSNESSGDADSTPESESGEEAPDREKFTSLIDSSEYIFVKEHYHDVADKTAHLYALYDALMAQYPEYITRTQIGVTAEPILPVYSKPDGETVNESITEESVFPIYRYDFNKGSEGTPKILYISGIHGGEYQQVFAAYRLFKALCENSGNAVLSELGSGVHFVVVPLANPFGFNYPSGRYDENGLNVSKRNERNIDVSGNFPSEEYVSGDDGEYGFEALSEASSQAIYKIICEEDFILSVDNHTFGYLASEYDDLGGFIHLGGYFVIDHEKDESVDFWDAVCFRLNQHLRILSPELDKTVLTHSDGAEYCYAERLLFELWDDERAQMLCNTFKGVSANFEMPLSIDPQNVGTTDGATPFMPKESQAFLVDSLALIFYDAMLTLA